MWCIKHNFQQMESIIHSLQEDYISVPITGLFLIYPKYFVHVIEVRELSKKLFSKLEYLNRYFYFNDFIKKNRFSYHRRQKI